MSSSAFVSAAAVLGRQVLPILGAFRYLSKGQQVGTAIGACILLNEDGWCLSCRHIVEGMTQILQEGNRGDEWAAITADRSLPNKEKQQRLRKLGTKPKFQNAAIIWGHEGAVIEDAGAPEKIMDAAVFRITNLKLPPGYKRPRFRTDALQPGEMLCRTGYPLLEDKLAVQWNGAGFSANGRPALFVNSGVVSRFLTEGPLRIIELDSPGLRGQSGGPIFDDEARICGLQFRTTHYPLGFGNNPPSYYHVGQAIDAAPIRAFLDALSIEYAT